MNWQGGQTTFTLVWVAPGFDWSQVAARVLVCNWAIGTAHVHLVDGTCVQFVVSHN